MKLVFAGTPDFAAQALAALLAAGHDIALVLTQPDRPAGRGLVIAPSPVKQLALDRGLPVLQPHGLRVGGRHDADARAAEDALRQATYDAMIVAAYGLIVPPTLLALPHFGCINIHASLLPRWRGAAPVQRAIEAGDAETGITIMQMEAGLDTGPILFMRSVAIEPSDTGASLTDRLAVLGGACIVDALPLIGSGRTTAIAQDETTGAVTYAAKLTKAESPLAFELSTRRLVDRVRAFDPWPGASAVLLADGAEPAPWKIWKARTVADGARGRPGCVLGFDDDGCVVVATADGAVALVELQKPGGRRLAAHLMKRDFQAGAEQRFVASAEVM